MKPLTSLCILLVENDDDTRRIFTRILSMQGFRVHDAKTIAHAKMLLADNQCDLMISDLSLTDGCGEDLMREVKKTHGLKGLAITGHAFPERIQAAKSAGFDEVLVKPVLFTVLLAAIERHANRR